jgi:putative heme-binding domain-containing protein
MNTERLEREGSGYVGRHEPDFAIFGDPWFRGIDLATGPDGGVFVLDWSDTGECHENTGVHRTSGRIFKITHQADAAPPRSGAGAPPARTPRDLHALSSTELAELHRHENAWFARAARQLLQERDLAGKDLAAPRATLTALLDSDASAALRLRALWTLRLIRGADDAKLRALLRDGDEHIRTWAIRLLTDEWPLDLADGRRPARAEAAADGELLREFARLAREDSSGLVRLTLASTLQRLPVAQRAVLAAPLLAHAEDAADHNLPLLVWFGIAPLGANDAAALTQLASECQWPLERRFITRRLATDLEKNPAPLNALLTLATAKAPEFQNDVMAGLGDAFKGWRKAPKPAAWDAFSAATGPTARELSALFGDGRALDDLKAIVLDKQGDLEARKTALQTLVDARVPDLRALCEQLIGERYLNTIAIRGLAPESDPKLGAKLIQAYNSFATGDRPQVIAVLVTRAAWAKSLLDAVADDKVPHADLSAFHARQIRDLNDAALMARLTEVWGELRESTESKRQLIAKLRADLTPTRLANADQSRGRAAFSQICAACHTLYGEGGKIGPDLTGSGRDNLDYLLENIADPSAVVTADFRLTTLTLKDGRILAGVIGAKTDRTLTLRTLADAQTIERTEIAKQEESPLSMMPEGLLEALMPAQVLDLFAYLMGRQQVPLPTAK